MAPDWEDPKFWFTNIREKSAFDLLGALALNEEKRLSTPTTSPPPPPPLKGGVPMLIVINLTKLRDQGGEKIQGNVNISRGTTGN